jgi:hypothetical protein
VEQPFRDARFNQARIFRWSLAGSLAFVAVGGVGIATGGFESRFVTSLSPADRTLYASMKENTGDRADRAPKELGDCQFLASMPTEAFEARFEGCAAKHGKADLVVGDSHGIQLFGMVAQADTKRFVVGLAQGGCRPFENRPGCHYEAALTFANERRAQIRRVVFGHAGFYFFSPGRGAAGSRDLFRRPELPPLVLAAPAIEATAAYLERVAAVVPVVWVGPGIEPHVDVTNFHELRGAEERALPEIARRYRMLDAALAEGVGRTGKVRYLSRIGLFEAKEPLRLYDDGCLIYRDTDHLSPCAEQRLGPLLLRALE